MINDFTPLLGYISWSSFQCSVSFITAQIRVYMDFHFSKCKYYVSNHFKKVKKPQLSYCWAQFGQK